MAQVLDVLPIDPSGEPCSPALRRGAWVRLKSLTSEGRARELRKLLREQDTPPAGPVGRMRRHGLGAYPVPSDGDVTA